MGSFLKTKIDPREHLNVRIFDRCELSFENCFIQIPSYSRSNVRRVRMIYEKTKGQIALRPSLGKQNIQVKEVYRPSRVFQISSPVHFATAVGSRPSALLNWRKKFSLLAETNGPTQENESCRRLMEYLIRKSTHQMVSICSHCTKPGPDG